MRDRFSFVYIVIKIGSCEMNSEVAIKIASSVDSLSTSIEQYVVDIVTEYIVFQHEKTCEQYLCARKATSILSIL